MEFTPLSSVAHSKTSNRIHWTYFRMNFNSPVLGVFQYATVHLLDIRGQLYLSKNVTKKSWEYLVLAKVVFAICFPVAGIVTRLANAPRIVSSLINLNLEARRCD